MSWSHRPSDLGHHFILSPQNVVSSLIKKILTEQLSLLVLLWNLWQLHYFNMEPKILSNHNLPVYETENGQSDNHLVLLPKIQHVFGTVYPGLYI